MAFQRLASSHVDNTGTGCLQEAFFASGSIMWEVREEALQWERCGLSECAPHYHLLQEGLPSCSYCSYHPCPHLASGSHFHTEWGRQHATVPQAMTSRVLQDSQGKDLGVIKARRWEHGVRASEAEWWDCEMVFYFFRRKSKGLACKIGMPVKEGIEAVPGSLFFCKDKASVSLTSVGTLVGWYNDSYKTRFFMLSTAPASISKTFLWPSSLRVFE